LKIAVLKERDPLETRVSATPETVKKFTALGAEMVVETGAGEIPGIADEDFAEAGATVGDRSTVLTGADFVFCVRSPEPAELAVCSKGVKLVGALDPFGSGERVQAYADAGIDALAMEFMPRITRAQSMDILSSQSNLAGYKAVLDAASEYVGVAGLQAIATARRLGAQVSATDVRSATKEQIESLGAKPIFVEAVEGIEGEGSGGYATEMSAEYQEAQAELVSSHIAKQDIVITTALIPGRPAPQLISDAQLATMRPGSVIIDLAVEQGGNVEGAVAGEIVEKYGVKIVGHKNMSGRLAADASALFSRNLYNFLSAFWDEESDVPVLPDDDEIVLGIRLVKDGAIVNDRLLAS
jgi:NAD(P) transhydrogenase subunit alpha